MLQRARVMLKVGKLFALLPPADQCALANDIYRVYGRALTGAERTARYREKIRDEDVTPPVTEERHEQRDGSPSHAQEVVSGLPTRKAETNHLRSEAIELLNFLNLKANRSFRPVDSTLRLIIARLRSGVSVQDCKGVIARQVREWKGTEHEKYLRPETLFNATKFESYLGQKGTPFEEET